MLGSTNSVLAVLKVDHDIIHDNSSSDLALSASLNDLDFATLNMDCQSMEFEAPPDIIPIHDDDYFIDDEDDIPHLLDFVDEVLTNVDDDDAVATVVYFNVSSSSMRQILVSSSSMRHGGEGGNDAHPSPSTSGCLVFEVLEAENPPGEAGEVVGMEEGRGYIKPPGTLRSRKPWKDMALCGVNLLDGTCLNCTYGDGKPITCCGCEGPLRGGFCSFCFSRNENSFAYDPKPNYFDNDQNFSDYPPQPRYETNICELCGNDAHYGYNCPTQVPFNSNPDPCYNQNFDNNFPLTSPSFPKQYLCCENCGGPHATFQCQPMNQDFYNSNLSGFNQFQPPQFPVNYPPHETSKEILRAREDLMEAIQAFLKEYDHIPPNEKCMALLLAEERFLKIKQTMEEEQNQPEVMQELLLKLMNDLQILKGIQQEKKETAAQSFTPYWNFSMIDDEEARENFMKDICTFLRKFSRISFGVTPKVLLIAWERFGEIKHALTDKQYRQEDIQELTSKLLEDERNISE
ncbi:hypothetical protein Tco_0440067 [Tanacetum coccineum]